MVNKKYCSYHFFANFFINKKIAAFATISSFYYGQYLILPLKRSDISHNIFLLCERCSSPYNLVEQDKFVVELSNERETCGSFRR